MEAYTDVLPSAGASALNSRAVWSAIEPEPGKFDFSSIDRQIAFAEKNSLKLILIIEFNPFCKPQWAMKEAQDADQSTKDVMGNDGGGGFPSHRSTVYRELQESFIQHLTERINKGDTNHVITHYQAGIEWWFPYSARYSSMGIIFLISASPQCRMLAGRKSLSYCPG